ncbi:response regulator transcription factor [Undibacterium amnicola]|uniref:Response regulator transcription factor n=1 Tax=Undibacterium amnicola TaxID=1834038 RepID=A0ABR6XQ70_9BURK|nr:LytTR family DNA-binding domain-containing protein [Undibacterium amnicola]MBC3831649.1 response regulator transcription factor [Undibacterium amnicola]
MPIRYMIVDDEPIAHRIIEDYCAEISNLALVNNSYNALAALEYLNSHTVDLIFLDINMPKLKGFEFLRTLKQAPPVIVTSAHQEYAITGYEFDVCDYLLKPFSLARFMMAINKVPTPFASAIKQSVPSAKPENIELLSIFVKGDKKQHQVFLADIVYIEACGNYSILHFKEGKLITQQTLSGFEKQLPSDQFIRIHKSFIVAKAKVQAIEAANLLLANKTIPIGQSYKKMLSDWIK